MKRVQINIMLLSLGIAIFTALYFLSKRNVFIMNKCEISINKAFHFNLTPVLGISCMAIGEFFLWESQNNNRLIEIKAKLIHNLKLKLAPLQLELIKLSNSKL
jgi:hypothetical protein